MELIQLPSNYKELKKISIDTGDTIDSYTFKDCTKLESIEFDSPIITIGDGAFEGCTALTNIRIPKGVTTIGRETFAGCENLTSVRFPRSIQECGEEIFRDCHNLKKIIIPIRCPVLMSILKDPIILENHTTFVIICSKKEEERFRNENKDLISSMGEKYINFRHPTQKPKELEAHDPSIPITSQVEKLDEGNPTSDNNESEKIDDKIEIVEDWPTVSVRRKKWRIEETVFCDVPEDIKRVNLGVPSTIEEIKVSYNCPFLGEMLKNEDLLNSEVVFTIVCTKTALLKGDFLPGQDSKEVALLKSQGRIRYEEKVENLTQNNSSKPRILKKEDIPEGVVNYVVPNDVIKIDDEAFAGNPTLESITIPRSVVSIGEGAFKYCKNLKQVNLSEGLKRFGKCAFSNCSSLQEVIIPSTVKEIPDECFIFCTSLSRVAMVEKDTVRLERTFFEIGENKYQYTKSTYSTSESVLKIGQLAFSECEKLEELKLPSALEFIGFSSFSYCHSLENVKIPDSVLTIENNAFWGCHMLRYLELSRQLKNFGGGNLGFTEVESITIPEGVEEIKCFSFSNNEHLQEINLSAGIKRIDSMAFQSLLSLKTITIPVTCSAIMDLLEMEDLNAKIIITYDANSEIERLQLEKEDDVIKRKYQGFIEFKKIDTSERERTTKVIECLTNDKVSPSSKTYIIPYGTIELGTMAFYQLYNLKRVIIPPTVKKIGESAFESCKGLIELTIPERVEEIGKSCFKSCSSLRKIEILSNVKKIADSAFCFDRELREIRLPNSITSIGEWAFASCQSLEEFDVPPLVESIGPCAFYKCWNLKRIKLPNGLKIIDSCAFEGCSALKSVIVPNSVVTIEEWAFSDCKSLEEITLPASIKELNEDALSECNNLKKINIKFDTHQQVLDFISKQLGGKIREMILDQEITVSLIGPLTTKEHLQLLMKLGVEPYKYVKPSGLPEPENTIEEPKAHAYTKNEELDKIIESINRQIIGLPPELQKVIDFQLMAIIRDYNDARERFRPKIRETIEINLISGETPATSTKKEILDRASAVLDLLKSIKELIAFYNRVCDYKKMVESPRHKTTSDNAIYSCIKTIISQYRALEVLGIEAAVKELKQTLIEYLEDTEKQLLERLNDIIGQGHRETLTFGNFEEELEEKLGEKLNNLKDSMGKTTIKLQKLFILQCFLFSVKKEDPSIGVPDCGLRRDIITTLNMISKLSDGVQKQQLQNSFKQELEVLEKYIEEEISTNKHENISYENTEIALRKILYESIKIIEEGEITDSQRETIKRYEGAIKETGYTLDSIKNSIYESALALKNSEKYEMLKEQNEVIPNIILGLYTEIRDNPIFPDEEKTIIIDTILMTIIYYQAILMRETCTEENTYQIARLLTMLASIKKKVDSFEIRYREYLSTFSQGASIM